MGQKSKASKSIQKKGGKMRKIIFLLVVVVVFLMACEGPTRVYISDNNQDGVYHWGPGDIIGNTSLDFHSATEDTPAYTVLLNLSPVNIGYDVRKRDDGSFVCFADSYISGNDESLQYGQLPINEWLKIRIVIYKSGLLGAVVVFIESLGLDFFNDLQAYMIDSVHEAEFIFVPNKGVQKIKLSDLDWKEIPKEEFFK
jgi:hypothetical protein